MFTLCFPGIFQGIVTIESIMDHIAHYLGRDPLQVREVNLAPAGAERPSADPIVKNVFQEDILPLLKESAEYELRLAEVDAFNQVGYRGWLVNSSLWVGGACSLLVGIDKGNEGCISFFVKRVFLLFSF